MSDLIPDFIDIVPAQILPNMVPFFDGCNWTMVVLPADWMTCPEVIACMEPTITAMQLDINTKLECSDLAACQTIIDITSSILALPATILWQVEFIASSINTGTNFTVGNNWLLAFQGTMGMRVDASSWFINIMLPGGGLDWEILTRNATTWLAERSEPDDLYCDRIQDCMQPLIDGLQNQINNINAWGWAGTDDFVSSTAFNPTSWILSMFRVLWGFMTVDISWVNTDDYLVSWSLNTSTYLLSLVLDSGAIVSVDLSALTSAEYTQAAIASASVSVPHSLGKRCNVVCTDPAWLKVEPDSITYIDANNVDITFIPAFTWDIRCN